MSVDCYIRFRIDPVIKKEAVEVLAALGLTLSDACRMILEYVAREKRLPFELKDAGAPNRHEAGKPE